MIISWFRRHFLNRFHRPEPPPHPLTPETPEQVALALAKVACTHPKVEGPITLEILGHSLKFGHIALCPSCMVKYLSKVSEICATCGKPILPGMSIAQAHINASNREYVHHSDACSLPGMYCGRWGYGRLIPLEECHPESFKEPGPIHIEI